MHSTVFSSIAALESEWVKKKAFWINVDIDVWSEEKVVVSV